MTSNHDHAKLLAERPYPIRITWDRSSDGQPGFRASVDGLPSCAASGFTEAEAKQALKSSMAEFIEVMLDLELPVPKPPLWSAPSLPADKDTYSAAASAHHDELVPA